MQFLEKKTHSRHNVKSSSLVGFVAEADAGRANRISGQRSGRATNINEARNEAWEGGSIGHDSQLSEADRVR
jgi:hypothetical protein